ncbi:MAG: acyl-CoA dehydrogenase family protein [Burkholderiaceae bacterium]
MTSLLSDSIDRLLASVSTPAAVRLVERSGAVASIWEAIEQSGYLDALVPEDAGGVGMALAEVFPLFLAAGRHALPAPLSQTILARAALAAHGHRVPPGAIAIASQARVDNGGILTCRNVPFGRVAHWVVACLPDGWLLLQPAHAACSNVVVSASLQAHLEWRAPAEGWRPHAVPAGMVWTEIGAAATAAEMAGAMESVLKMTVEYVNERTQFGRSIGKFQAVQQALSILAEQVFAARIAAQIGCTGPSLLPTGARVAMAKGRVGDAAEMSAPIAHAAHGAMGVTSEYALQLFTRRLHEGALDYGSASYWHRQLGIAVLQAPHGTVLDFMLTELCPGLGECTATN